jgi:hypothetical protein
MVVSAAMMKDGERRELAPQRDVLDLLALDHLVQLERARAQLHAVRDLEVDVAKQLAVLSP